MNVDLFRQNSHSAPFYLFSTMPTFSITSVGSSSEKLSIKVSYKLLTGGLEVLVIFPLLGLLYEVFLLIKPCFRYRFRLKSLLIIFCSGKERD
jgi:hypothetical protein